jgi:SAM-dependent methyltransferase
VSDVPAAEVPSEVPGPPLDLDAQVDDRLVLQSLPGALDYLTAELADASSRENRVTATVVRRHPDALVVDWSGPLAPLSAIRFFSGCAVLLHDSPPDQGVADEIDDWCRPSRTGGVLRVVEAAGPPTFRVAPDLGAARWPIRDHAESTWGWRNEPGGWQLNVRLDHGTLVCEIGALYQTARFGRMVRLPASTTPVVSAVLARLLKPERGHLVLDPFCGAATNLLTVVSQQPDVRLIGADVQSAALAAARENLGRVTAEWRLLRADAGNLPLDDGCVDRVVANLPFGKRVGSHGVNVELYPRFLRELTRILTTKGRAVLLTDDKRLFVESVQRTADIRIVKEIQVATGGVHPTAYVVTRGRSRRSSKR